MPVYLFGLWQGLQLVKEPQRQGWADIFEETKEEHTAEQCDRVVAGVECHRSHVEHIQSGHYSLNLKKKPRHIFIDVHLQEQQLSRELWLQISSCITQSMTQHTGILDYKSGLFCFSHVGRASHTLLNFTANFNGVRRKKITEQAYSGKPPYLWPFYL